MSATNPQDQEFLNQLNNTIRENLEREEFGVSELAELMNMSRSNLLRKVKKVTDLSVAQLISQTRLQQAMELLKTTSLNVSEVGHQVGFSSTSYFIKCFRENYGYPPGEVGKRDAAPQPEIDLPSPVELPKETSIRKYKWVAVVALLLIGVTAAFMFLPPTSATPELEKSIVVLPFKNESTDSANVYLINGLMDATLNNLQKIRDLKVLSRTSAEKYRNVSKTIPEIAQELSATYFVEGSGQKIADQIVLNIRLIEGASDRRLWGKQYRRKISDIFTLQQDIANDIAFEINAVITPEERTRIEKPPTNNATAYDLFLKGADLLNKGGEANLLRAVTYFQDAIKEDPDFALAYACTGIAYYYLDVFRADKKYVDLLGSAADKALLFDPKLGESLTAKALYYMVKKEYKQALPYLEKAYEYNPNSSQIIALLADYYGTYVPNTGKYLEYALKGARLGAGSSDSMSVSYSYLRLGNALIQSGFVDESLIYIDKSLQYNPDNFFSRYVKAFVLYARDGNLNQTKELLIKEFKKDTTRFDILQSIGKVTFYLRQYDSAAAYYDRFNRFREQQKLDVYQHEDMTIGVAYAKAGQIEKSKPFIESYRRYLERDQTAYKQLGLAAYFYFHGEEDKGLEHLKLFSKEDNVQYWIILFLWKDPMLEEVKNKKELKKVLKDIEDRFWKNHARLKEHLQEQELI
jgi:TolB-like protein/AraC-like DNA-binding protein